MAIALRYAALSDVGLVRSNNQDSGYAGPRLLVIADGMGGHAGGDVASSLAIGELAFLDAEAHGPDALATELSRAVRAAHTELLRRVAEEPSLSGMGTTVTALLRTGGRLALAHIGDSRAYLLRDRGLTQITRDHTFVQRLVDDGRITPEEAEQHPQRSVLMRVLSDVVENVEPDISIREAKIGDRYLLCSDGLSGVVSLETLEQTLADGADPSATCEQLVHLALRGGAPDNVTCIVADVVDTAAAPTDTVPQVVGAAAQREPPRTRPAVTPAERAAELARPPAQSPGMPATAQTEPAPGRRRPALRVAVTGVAVVAVLALGGWGAYRWSQGQFFVGDSAGVVAVYRGLPQNLGPISLSSISTEAADVPVADLPTHLQRNVREGIVADDEAGAQEIVQRLRLEAVACRSAQVTPTPSPSVAGTPTATPSPVTPAPTPSPVTPAAPAGPGVLGPAPSAVAPSTSVAAGTPSATVGAGTPTATVGPTATLGPSATARPGAGQGCRVSP